MTYARKMMFKALKATWQVSMEETENAVEDVIRQVIERCAGEAVTCAFPHCSDAECVIERAAADRIRSLSTAPGTGKR